ncbi:MAG: nucleoside triphosphate pyrophosphatase [Pirellulaceae bacterium]|nr:septum formation protein Maf [Planctomycetaceae bacterium]HIM30243.1 septum formation protein Maf [Planctomycetota bacterium]
MNRQSTPLILASASPRRRQLLLEAGYDFQVIVPSATAECGVCSRETPPELVARLARQKAEDVAKRLTEGLVIGCDTLAECRGQMLGKPKNREHAGEMLRFMRGREHSVYSGLCLWLLPQEEVHVQVDRTRLQMIELTDSEIDSYLDTNLWEGKAGAFGLQDRLGWIEIVEGSESNVVGLPMELLTTMLAACEC